MWTIFSLYQICYDIASVLCFVFFFGLEACGILAFCTHLIYLTSIGVFVCYS